MDSPGGPTGPVVAVGHDGSSAESGGVQGPLKPGGAVRRPPTFHPIGRRPLASLVWASDGR